MFAQIGRPLVLTRTLIALKLSHISRSNSGKSSGRFVYWGLIITNSGLVNKRALF